MNLNIACPRVHSSPTMLNLSDSRQQKDDLSQCNILIEGVDSSSPKELHIHSLLNDLCVYKINVQEYIQDKQRVTSEHVKMAFAQQRISQSGTTSFSSGSPSFLQKRLRNLQLKSQISTSVGQITDKDIYHRGPPSFEIENN